MTHTARAREGAHLAGTKDETASPAHPSDPPSDHELATLVRRWMQVGPRGRREALPEDVPVEEALVEEALVEDVLVATPVPVSVVEPVVQSVVEPDAEPDAEPVVEPVVARRARRAPALPHRPAVDEPEPATRLAVLIDARRVADDVAAGLLARLGERGSVNVCRAYADWSRVDMGAWVGRLRREGLHSFHQFAEDDDQALVAMAIDAVDIAREAGVDEVVVAGDLTSMLPLVHRLHAAGVRVVLVGSALTPHDVRGACDEFLLAESLAGAPVAPAGRHRA